MIPITEMVEKLRSDEEQDVSSELFMPDKFAESARRLEQLVHQITKATDPALYDELAEEIWRVLAERERLAQEERMSGKKTYPDAA